MTERILVLSDCHLTSGLDPETGVWSPTEDFFWDKEFVEFLEHYSNEKTTLIMILCKSWYSQLPPKWKNIV